MRAATRKRKRIQETIHIRTEDTQGCQVTHVHLGTKTEVACDQGWLIFWTDGREIRVGPLSPDQAEKLSEDLGYESLD